MDDLLQQGITAYKAGNRDEARKIFITVVKQSPDSEPAWGWMYQVSNNDNERAHCLRQILRINPNSEKAKQLLDKLTGSDFPFDSSQNAAQPLQTQKNNLTPVSGIPQQSGAASNPIKQKSSYSANIVTAITVGIVGVCLLICVLSYLSGGGGGGSSRTVRYVVTGNTSTSSVSYTNETGGSNSADVRLPFQKDIVLKESGFVSILAWPGNSDLSGTVTCEVWVNGKMEETTTANNTLVTCGAFVP